jgi:hypothetical protein
VGAIGAAIAAAAKARRSDLEKYILRVGDACGDDDGMEKGLCGSIVMVGKESGNREEGRVDVVHCRGVFLLFVPRGHIYINSMKKARWYCTVGSHLKLTDR